MSFVYVVAANPWGPVRFEVAEDLADLMRRVTGAPAHVEQVDGRDARQVVEAAARALGPVDDKGWITAKVEAAVKALRKAVEACPPISATPIARQVVEAGPGQPVSDGAALPFYKLAKNSNATLSKPLIDVRTIRLAAKMSQTEFAGAFGLPVATLRDWEQGRNSPDRAAVTLLRVIEHRPQAVREAVAVYGPPVGARSTTETI